MHRISFLIGLLFMPAVSFLLTAWPAAAEVHTITATGEYRMAAKDTPEEAKQRALLGAQRLVLEKAWAYLQGVTELKPLRLSLNDIQEYTRGLIEITEGASQSQREGETVIVRTDVTATVDSTLVLRRINAIRQSQAVGD
ncbi:MAG: hypothetical protein HY581_06960 [Nitrospirae bacterium]|nr:hypothetical protein [Nitrospirota bacterium]